MANPTADDFRKMIADGDFDQFVSRFTRACATWRNEEAEHYGPVLTELYELGDTGGLDALERVLESTLVYQPGPWQGVKRIFKLAEERRDPRFYGVISWMIDTNAGVGRIHVRTRQYLKRRTWRALRTLPKSAPEHYAPMALGLIERYTDYQLSPSDRCRRWAYNHVGWHGTQGGQQPGNSDNWYTITRWRQRAAKRWAWQADTWMCLSYDQYPFAEQWRGQLGAILDSMARVKAGITVRLLVSILQHECADELAAIDGVSLAPLFRSPLMPVVEFALETVRGLPPDRIEPELVFELMEHRMPAVVEWALAFLSEHLGLAQLGLARVCELVASPGEQIATWAMGLIREQADAADIAWEQVCGWFDSPNPDVREQVIAFVNERWDVWSPPADEMFNLLELPHPDVHTAVFGWLLQRYPFEDLGRENIFDLFDSDWADVRDFARRTLERYFDRLDALADLGRLAEHPEPSVQHWVVELVHEHLREDADRLVRLMPFFRRVVFHVNRGGREKEAIFTMLIELAAGSRARAEAVVALCAEFVRAFGRIEHVKSLVGLARLRQRYADLDVPIELVAPPAAAPAGPGPQ